MTTRPNRTNQVLKIAQQHLEYELMMLHGVAELLGPGYTHGEIERNALVESFAVHVWAITDFFWPSQAVKPDDIIAADFYSDPTGWIAVCPPPTDKVTAARIRAHKEVAHLTYARLEVQSHDKPWDLSVGADLYAVRDLFLATADRVVAIGATGPR